MSTTELVASERKRVIHGTAQILGPDGIYRDQSVETVISGDALVRFEKDEAEVNEQALDILRRQSGWTQKDTDSYQQGIRTEILNSELAAKDLDTEVNIIKSPDFPTVRPTDKPKEECELARRWEIQDRNGETVAIIDVFGLLLDEETDERVNIGYLSWSAQITEERLEEITPMIQKYSSHPANRSFWDLEDGNGFCFDYDSRTVWIGTTNERNPGVTIDYLDDTGPDDPMIQEVFCLTARPNLAPDQRKKLAEKIAAAASQAVREPF